MNDFKSRLPRDLYTAAQVRELDRIAIEVLKIPGFELMRRASLAALALLVDLYPQTKQIMVFAGPGKNGGDGALLAALARQKGLKVELIQVGNHENLKGEALEAHREAMLRGVPMGKFDQAGTPSPDQTSVFTVIVDAMLGTGLDRDVAPEFSRAIDVINNFGVPVFALDLPSGLCADTGRVRGAAVRAHHTATFIAMKRGLLTHEAPDYCGQIHYFPLDIPESLFKSGSSPRPDCLRIDMQSMRSLLSPRPPSSHKGNFGHTVIMGGDYGFGGAAIMAGEAALRCGSGLVSVITRPEHIGAALARRPELMMHGVNELSETVEGLLDRASVIVVGPGLGRSSWSRSLFQAALAAQRAQKVPLVIDADALNLLAESDAGIPRLRRDNWILTPHPGEAARLLQSEIGCVQQDRFASVRRLQEKWGGVCLLKGAGSLICFDADTGQETRLCSEGNAGMASGGMGDVLSGLIAAFVAQGHDLANALQLAVCVHGESADLAAATTGQRGLLATDLFPYISQLVNPGC